MEERGARVSPVFAGGALGALTALLTLAYISRMSVNDSRAATCSRRAAQVRATARRVLAEKNVFAILSLCCSRARLPVCLASTA
jgi:hypothetical protein